MNILALNNGSADFPLPPATAARPVSVTSYLEAIKESLGEMWLPHIYRERIRPMRTRSHELEIATKPTDVKVQHTLLGVELKVGNRRILCPDLATARYLAVFARAGCSSVAVPYDITRISLLADELESSWQRMLLLVEHLAGGRSATFRSRIRRALVSEVQKEIAETGAGTAIPQFNQNTKQRRAKV